MYRFLVAFFFLPMAVSISGAEIARLTPQTWDQYAPLGKEVDCIYGDYVLRNDRIVVVIAEPLPTRNANMTVRSVGGMIIDLTSRSTQNDQLSCYYPNSMPLQFNDPEKVSISVDGKTVANNKDLMAQGKSIAWEVKTNSESGLEVSTSYLLADGEEWLSCITKIRNPKNEDATQALSDLIRADKSFEFGNDDGLGLFWAHDDFFRQCYGVMVEPRRLNPSGGRNNVLQMLDDKGNAAITLKPGTDYVLKRRILVGASLLEVRGLAQRATGKKTTPVKIVMSDERGPVVHVKITVSMDGKILGTGRTTERGELAFDMPPGKIRINSEALGREKAEADVMIDGTNPQTIPLAMSSCGYVVAHITTDAGQPTPCKVSFQGKAGTASPEFGPETTDTAVRNLHYSHNGKFRQEIGPGKYDVIISYGPEHDAVFTEITVERGKETKLEAKLRRSVDTSGWISSDFHSHSTPSGDNTSSQLGRIQNLLCEHVEFCPCTEHNRIDTYVPWLKKLGVESWMATCSGMELTGQLLPVNHQNAFPLIYKPRLQDGGGPVTDTNPIVQIERLAMWDGDSDKLVQENHPNLVQILADKDEDGKFDGGFSGMLGVMDVVEVHPLEDIFTPPKRGKDGKLSRNAIFHWMQLLNLGHRIPGVVNTDAHYTFHGSGWLRNFLRSPTDDPAKVDTMDMVHSAEQGHVVMTTGPFMEVSLKATNAASKKPAGIPGDDVIAPDGIAELHVRVQCPNWFDVDRVQVFLNGRPEPSLNFTRREKQKSFSDGVVKFDATIPVEVKFDTHLIVATMGEGVRLGPVMGADLGKQWPIAVSNPIFIDVDGKGFQPNGDLLDVPLPK